MRSFDPGTSPAAAPADVGRGAARVWPLALAAGLAAGVISWLAGEAAYGFFAPTTAPTRLMGGPVVDAVNNATRAAADAKNTALASGLLGAAVGLIMGLAGGLARRSPRAAAGAALVGLTLGAAAGAGMSSVLFPIYYRNERFIVDDLGRAMLLHAGVWGAVGAAGGLAFGLGLGGRSRAVRALLGGLVGAALATALYEVVGAAAFPLARTYRPLATGWGPRLLARLAVAVLSAAGAALAVQSPRARPGRRLGSSATSPTGR
jgi:hypothetical protein